MSRRRGFTYAQLDSAFLADPKFVKLARTANSHFLEAIGLWTIALAHAWASDDPDVADVLAEHGTPELVALLEGCKLIVDSAIPKYEAWTEDVRHRRETSAERQRRFRNAPSRDVTRDIPLHDVTTLDYDPKAYADELQAKLLAKYGTSEDEDVTPRNALPTVTKPLSRTVTGRNAEGRGGEGSGGEQIKDQGATNGTSSSTRAPFTLEEVEEALGIDNPPL